MGSKPSGSLFGAAGVDFADKLALAIGGAVTLGFFSATLRPGFDGATVGLLIATGLGTGLDTGLETGMGAGLVASTTLVMGTIGCGAGAVAGLVAAGGAGGLCRACKVYQPADAATATITAAITSPILLLRWLAGAGSLAGQAAAAALRLVPALSESPRLRSRRDHPQRS